MVATATLLISFVGVHVRPPISAAATGDVGYEGLSFSGTSEPTGTKRAESALWWNDGSWWGNVWDTTSGDFHIFRLDLSTQTWVDTEVTVDTRSNTSADVRWDGVHLYVASHRTLSDETAAIPGYPSNLYRFSYNPGTDTYSLDSGFPVQINNYRTETLVIDKDSTGTLWATWQQDNTIYVNRTLNADDLVWGTPFPLPVDGTSVTVDDNSAVIAFDGDKIGVLWSNEVGSHDAMYFAVHLDGQPADSWVATRAAFQGPNAADDHINLKSVQADSSGRVYAAIKTGFTSSAQPLITLLVRDPSTGDWASNTIARVSDCPNRPLVLIDEENRVIHAFYTAPAPSGSCTSSGGAIYEKTSSLDAIAFPVGAGTPVILDASSLVHNVTTTKQNLTSQTGIVVLARNSSTNRYWHHYATIAGSPGGTPPTAAFSGTPTSGIAPLNVAFTDASVGSPTSWSWTFGDGGTSTAQHPTHTYSAAGTYTVGLTATSAAGSDPETKIGYIIVSAAASPPTAAFSGTPTSGIAPLNVAFTDASVGSPTSWSWTFGDGGTSTAQHPMHTYSAAGTYTVSLTATNAAGSDPETKTDYIVVSPPPPDFSVTASPSKGVIVRGNGTSFAVTITPTNGFNGTVTLSVAGMPAGVLATFNPPTLSGAASSTSTLAVTTSSTTKVGSYTLTITAVSGSLQHTTTAVLQVKRR